MSNIWLAAGEGSLVRVQELVQSGTSPNLKDDNSYSALHAAASWNQPDILRYLVQTGGDINLTDDDGDTPLYVVEQVAMAKLVVELGGNPRHLNQEGLTPAAALQEEYPHISLYLRTLTGESNPSSSVDSSSSAASQSQTQAQAQPDLDTPTDALMTEVRSIMEAAERGELAENEVDDKLREVVERVVGGQVEAGRAIGEREMQAEQEGEGTRTRSAEEMGGSEEGVGKRSRDMDNIGR
ncbi:hypothetical protein JCM11641_005664 [Rhodosporidiobolus odoratus]